MSIEDNEDDLETTSDGEVIPLASLLRSHPETAFDYLEFRFITAGTSARMAAQRASEEDRRRIAQAFDKVVSTYEAQDAEGEFVADREFHLALYAASHNPIMENVMKHIFVMLHQDAFYDRNTLNEREGVRELLFRQHKAIFDAIMARDVEAACLAAEKHVLYIKDSLKESRMAAQRAEVAHRRLGRAGLAAREDAG